MTSVSRTSPAGPAVVETPRGKVGGDATPSPTGRRRHSTDAGALPYVLVAPVIVFIAGLALVPAVFTIVQSFFTVNALDPPTRFSGLANFRNLAESDAVLSSLANTALYVVVGVVLSTVLGVAMAILLQRPFRGRSLVIAVLILPWALPGVVEGILWSGIFDPNAGLVSSLMSDVGLGGGHLLLGENRLLTIVLIELVQVWQITPLSVLLVLAALQLIPEELYEAAQIDGCSRWGAIRMITLPLARPGIAVCMVQALVATLNVFDQPYVLNGAAATAATVTMQTYFVSFQNLDFGQGYALSLVITVLTLVGSLLIVKAVYRKVEL